MKKKFGLLLVAALASFALVGCGDSASSYKELTSIQTKIVKKLPLAIVLWSLLLIKIRQHSY